MIGRPRESKFVGRTDELAAIDRLLDALPEHGPSVMIVTGEAGLGKSRLVRELHGRAQAAGMLVATGNTSSDGVTLPYGTIVGLTGDLGRQLDPAARQQLIEPLQQQLLGSPAADASDGALARIQLLDTARRTIEELARARPVVLVVEDLHWADTGTVELLDFLARNLAGCPVLIATTYRPEVLELRSTVRRVFVELRRLPVATTFALSGLDRDDIAALLSDITGEQQSWAVVDAVHRRSEGNPLFAEELSRVRDTGTLPPALRDLLALRIEQLAPESRATVSAASVIGPSDYRLLARVVGVDVDALDAAMADAVRQGVLVADAASGVVEFRHALLREAAQTELLPAERARLHRRAAEAIASDASLVAGGPTLAAAALGEHWFEAGEWANACAASTAAAEASARLFAVHATYAHARRALVAHRLAAGACTHPEVDHVQLCLRVADTAGLVDEPEEAFAAAREAVEVIDENTPPDVAVAAFVALANAAWGAGLAEMAFASVAEAEARRTEAHGRAAAEVATMHARLLMISGRPVECIARCQEALPLARAAGARDLEAHILATLGPSLTDVGEYSHALEAMRAAADIADALGIASVTLRTYANFTHVLFKCGRLEEVATLALDAMREGGPLAIMRLGGAGYNAVEALVVLGRWTEADTLIAVAESEAHPVCMHTTIVPATLAVRRGDVDDAERLLEGQWHSPENDAQHQALLAEIALARGRPEDAAAAAERSLDAITGSHLLIEALTAHAFGLQALADQHLQPSRPSRRKAADPAKAERLVEAMLARVDECLADGPTGVAATPWIPALDALCRAEATRVLGADAAAWVRAADAWSRLDAPFHIAYCRYREAEARLASRADRRLATDALVDAWRTARRLGARLLVERCERLAERARIELEDPHDESGSPRDRAAADLALTAREVEVLDLLARGRSDAQIADELFVSKKTASVHVSNVVRKLDARDRYHAGEIGSAAGLGSTP